MSSSHEVIKEEFSTGDVIQCLGRDEGRERQLREYVNGEHPEQSRVSIQHQELKQSREDAKNKEFQQIEVRNGKDELPSLQMLETELHQKMKVGYFSIIYENPSNDGHTFRVCTLNIKGPWFELHCCEKTSTKKNYI